MNASDKDSPARLKTGFDPITPFSRKRKKNKKRKTARVFVAQFAHFGPKKVRAVGMSKNWKDTTVIDCLSLFFFVFYIANRDSGRYDNLVGRQAVIEDCFAYNSAK